MNLDSILPRGAANMIARIRKTEIGNRMMSGAFWALSGTAVSQGLMLITSIVVARLIGKADYGALGMIRSTVGMFTVFAGFGLGLTSTKFVAELRKTDPDRTGRIIGLTTLFAVGSGLLITALVLIFGGTIAEKTINAPHLATEIRLSTMIMFFGAVNGSQAGILAGFEAFKAIAKNNFIAGICCFPVQIGLTMFMGLDGAVIGLGINLLFLWVLHGFTVRKEARKNGIQISYSGSLIEWPILYKFSLPSVLSGLLVSPVLWTCNAMLVNQPHGFEEMAVFDAANQWRSAILFIPANLSQIALPLLAGSAENKKVFTKILKYNILIVFVISSIVALAVGLFSPVIMSLYGKGFSGHHLVLVILSISTVLFAVGDIFGKAIAGKGKMWLGFGLNIFWAFVIISATYLLVRRGYGATGLALANIIAYTVHILIIVFFISKAAQLNLTLPGSNSRS